MSDPITFAKLTGVKTPDTMAGASKAATYRNGFTGDLRFLGCLFMMLSSHLNMGILVTPIATAPKGQQLWHPDCSIYATLVECAISAVIAVFVGVYRGVDPSPLHVA
jgi:hypothetical protein